MLRRVPDPDAERPVVFSREGVRALDRHAIEALGIPGLILMENAAASIEAALLRRARAWWPGASAFGVLILCGPGNNGGDGYALARRLLARSVRVSIVGVGTGRGLSPDAAVNRSCAQRLGVPIAEFDASDPSGSSDRALGPLPSDDPVVLVDAILGTGVTRALALPFDAAAHEINALRQRPECRVLALDLPSGLDCDTGRPLGEAVVTADATVTLAGMKKGLLAPGARRFTGQVEVGSIGLPRSVLRAFGDAG